MTAYAVFMVSTNEVNGSHEVLEECVKIMKPAYYFLMERKILNDGDDY